LGNYVTGWGGKEYKTKTKKVSGHSGKIHAKSGRTGGDRNGKPFAPDAVTVGLPHSHSAIAGGGASWRQGWDKLGGLGLAPHSLKKLGH